MREVIAVLTILIGLAGMADAQASETSNQAIVLLIDTSGSMRDENRLIYAKEAAKTVARQLKDGDLFGVIGFNINTYIVVGLDKLTNNRKVVDAQIDGLKAGGYTDFLPALTDAKDALENLYASKKHVVLLSDGVTRGSPSALLNLVSEMLKVNITVSTNANATEQKLGCNRRHISPTLPRIIYLGGTMAEAVSIEELLISILLKPTPWQNCSSKKVSSRSRNLSLRLPPSVRPISGWSIQHGNRSGNRALVGWIS